MAREKTTAVPKFDKISIGLASPESILAVSRGEVTKPTNLNATGCSVSVSLVP